MYGNRNGAGERRRFSCVVKDQKRKKLCAAYGRRHSGGSNQRGLSGVVSVEAQRAVSKRKNQKYGVCSLEETAIKKMYIEKLRKVLDELPETYVYLIYLLFFEEVTVKETAQLCGCSRKTIENRRKRILKKLNSNMRELGIVGGCF